MKRAGAPHDAQTLGGGRDLSSLIWSKDHRVCPSRLVRVLASKSKRIEVDARLRPACEMAPFRKTARTSSVPHQQTSMWLMDDAWGANLIIHTGRHGKFELTTHLRRASRADKCRYVDETGRQQEHPRAPRARNNDPPDQLGFRDY